MASEIIDLSLVSSEASTPSEPNLVVQPHSGYQETLRLRQDLQSIERERNSLHNAKVVLEAETAKLQEENANLKQQQARSDTSSMRDEIRALKADKLKLQDEISTLVGSAEYSGERFKLEEAALKEAANSAVEMAQKACQEMVTMRDENRRLQARLSDDLARTGEQDGAASFDLAPSDGAIYGQRTGGSRYGLEEEESLDEEQHLRAIAPNAIGTGSDGTVIGGKKRARDDSNESCHEEGDRFNIHDDPTRGSETNPGFDQCSDTDSSDSEAELPIGGCPGRGRGIFSWFARKRSRIG